MQSKVSIVGGGSWATALVKLLYTNKHEIKWWFRQQETVDYVRQFHHNPRYLPSVEIHLSEENVSTNLREILSDSEWILLAIPSAYVFDILQKLTAEDFKGKKVITAVKGLVHEEKKLISAYLTEKFGVPQTDIVHISGPCHAEEVAAEKLSYLTFSSPNIITAKEASKIFACRFMKTSTSSDLVGTELASVLKNVYAICAGISIGLGYGDNFRAVFISSAMKEMEYMLHHFAPDSKERNMLSPSYLGDTLVTAYSQFSRNRTFGVMIGKGYSINAAILELNMVAEGYYATKTLRLMAEEMKLEMPLLESAYRILYGKIAPAIEMRLLSEKIN